MNMRFSVILLLLLTPWPALAAVGVFTETTGEVRIQRAEAWLAAAPGVNVEADDIIETGADSATQMEMKDGSVFRLGAKSRLLLSEYTLASDNSVLSAGINMLSGWMRFAVAKLRSTDRRYNIQTPTMTVGIRGTEGVLETGNDRNGLLMDEGEVEVQAPGAQRSAVRAGQFVEHRPGITQFRPGAPPRAFRERLPRTIHVRAERRAHLLKAQGVAPRHLRAVTREDHERFRREHPHHQKHFDKRFEKRRPGPGAADARSTPPPGPQHTARPARDGQFHSPPSKPHHSSQDRKPPEKPKKKDATDEKKPDKKKPEKRDRDDRRSAVPGDPLV
jgi:hypothetical protein